MYEDVKQIESMSEEEYRQALYYFQHPKEYEGDFNAFRDKVIEYIDKLDGRPIGWPLRHDPKL